MFYLQPQNANGTVISVTSTASELFDLINTAASTTAARAGYSHKANAIDITPEDGDLRIIFDSVNVPTSSKGFLLSQGCTYFLRNIPLDKMQMISVTGTVSCSIQVGNSSPDESSSALATSVTLEAGSVTIGDVNVLSQIPGTGATNLGKAEDAAHASGDTGVMALGVRNDTLAALAGTDGDYTPAQYDALGALYQNMAYGLNPTDDSVSTQPVEPSNTNTTALATSLVISAVPATCYEIRGHNDAASAQYIQIHDAASLPADTTVPEDVFLVAADSNFSITYRQGKSFTVGIVATNSSTLATKTIGAADCWFSAEYIAV